MSDLSPAGDETQRTLEVKLRARPNDGRRQSQDADGIRRIHAGLSGDPGGAEDGLPAGRVDARQADHHTRDLRQYSKRQRTGVRFQAAEDLASKEGRDTDVHRARKCLGERLTGELQWEVPGRVPQRRAVLESGVGPGGDRLVAGSLQPGAGAFRSRLHNAHGSGFAMSKRSRRTIARSGGDQRVRLRETAATPHVWQTSPTSDILS